jgi:hypothetical protein
VGYEILYCSRCQAQLRGRQFESGDAFRIEDQGVCKNCAPEVIKSLPPDKVQILLKQMVVAQGKSSPKTGRTPSAPYPPAEKPPQATAAGSRPPSQTPIWIGIGVLLVLVLSLGVWVIGGFGQAAATPPKAEAVAPRPSPPVAPPPSPPVAKELPPSPAPAKEPKIVKEPEPATEPLLPGLVGHWKLDEGSGNVVSDSSRTNNPGTLVNGPSWVRGKLGTALSFDGNTGVVSVPASAALFDLRKRGLTVSAWIFPRNGARGHLVDKSNANVGWLMAFKSDGRIQFSGDAFQGPELQRLSSKPVALTAWHHVAATWDGDRSASHAHIYINGVLSDGQGIDGSGNFREGSSPTLSIGNRRSQDRGFDGLIDDVRVYNRVLTLGEILNLANGAPK